MNISLIGMMGSGKTTVGRLLAEKLTGFSFFDTDEEIVKRENKSINKIFEEKNEQYFRKIEAEVLKEILQGNNKIISTGGGVVKSSENLKLLKEKSVVIYLKANAYTLYERIKNNKERPLLNVDNMREKIITLLSERSKFYEQAHIIIDSQNKKADIISLEIVEKLDNYGTYRC
ncbi:MAG: shikimate kinase [Candidatus Gastranaerophilales bacterium]|nr:shikimate kinase [Candidatus Gastranaerophilales bacterium]